MRRYWTIRELAEEIAKDNDVGWKRIAEEIKYFIDQGKYPTLESGDQYYDARYIRIPVDVGFAIIGYWRSPEP